MIKYRVRTAVLSAAVFASAPLAHASQLLYDGFSYTAASQLQGNTNTQETPNQTWALTGPANNGTTIASSGLTGPTNIPAATGLADQTSKSLAGADRISLESTIPDPSVATGTENIYYSCLIKVSAISAYATTTGSFFSGINNVSGASGTALSTAGGVLCIAAPTSGSTGANYVLGVGQNQSGAGARVFDETDKYTSSDTIFAVVDYILNPGATNDVAKLYLFPNPTTVSSTEPLTANAVSDDSVTGGGDVSTGGNGFVSFFVRNNSVEPTNILLDEVRVGTTWGDVVPTPEPATLGLIGLAVPLLARRRRHA